VEVLFGIPGTSCAALFDEAHGERLRLVVTSSELEAGYAADAYARLRGISAVSVSYGVGTLSLVNAIAGALVERSAVVVLNGGASVHDLWNERHRDVLFSHSTGRASTDLRVFEQITAFAARAETVDDVPALVDCAITVALREQRPVYIEIPRDLWRVACAEPVGALDPSRAATGCEEALAASIVERLQLAARPAVLLGEEIARYRLQSEALTLLRLTELPWATTLLGKSALPEDTPGFIGVYDSDLAPKPVRTVIEGADMLLALGCVFGVDHTSLVSKGYDRMVHVLDGTIRIQQAPPERGELKQLLAVLINAMTPGTLRSRDAAYIGNSYTARRRWADSKGAASQTITYDDLFATIDASLAAGWMVIADTCLGSYPAADLNVRGHDSFMANPVWLSIGHSIGAAVGAVAACDRPVLVICGDGGFQMTAQAVSTLAKYKSHVLVLVIDNGTYAIEQYLIDPRSFEDPQHPELPYVGLNQWDYIGLARALGATFAENVSDGPSLERALQKALDQGGTGLISVRVSSRDLPAENRHGMAMRGERTVPHETFRDHEIAHFGETIVYATNRMEHRAAVEHDNRNVVRLNGSGSLRVVVQKGRSFQRANPLIPVLLDRGRYLVVDLPGGVQLHEEPGCFVVVAEDTPSVGFHVRRAVAAPVRSDVSAILQRLSMRDLRATVEALAGLFTRHSLLPGFTTALEMAQGWLREAGCQVRRMELALDDGITANLIGERHGVSNPRRLYILCAHLDSVNHEEGAGGRAPGADDNATGTATVIAIARALACETLRHDVHFVLFGGEEQGLFGSIAYVAGLSTEDRERLAGVVNIDMAGSKNTPERSVLLEGAEVSRLVMEDLAQAAATYTSLTTQFSFNPNASDHVPFILRGLPAVLTIEGADGAYAHEHTARDTPEKIDYELHHEITAMNLAWLVEQTL
jgi:indolepyruvate decarboxylase